MGCTPIGVQAKPSCISNDTYRRRTLLSACPSCRAEAQKHPTFRGVLNRMGQATNDISARISIRMAGHTTTKVWGLTSMSVKRGAKGVCLLFATVGICYLVYFPFFDEVGP